jgi:hypothetical protein
MPQQKAPVSTFDQLAQRITDRLDTIGQGIADRLGPPSGSARYTQPQADDLWDTPDNSVDQNALFQALQQGITPEGAQAVALFKMAPELAKSVVGTPQPPDQAAMLAKLAQYPGRYVLTTGHSSDAADQVKFVAEQHKRAARRQQQQAPDAAPTTMPSTTAPQDASAAVPTPTVPSTTAPMQGGY